MLKRVPLILKDLAGFNFTWNCCFFSMKWILNFFQEGRLGEEESWRCYHTVWKFEDFSACKILREINFAILDYQKVLDLILVKFDPKELQNIFEPLMVISRKIWMTEKFLNFHTVYPALMQKIANPKQEMRREVPRKIGIWWRTWFCFFEIVISSQSTKVGKIARKFDGTFLRGDGISVCNLRSRF